MTSPHCKVKEYFELTCRQKKKHSGPQKTLEINLDFNVQFPFPKAIG